MAAPPSLKSDVSFENVLRGLGIAFARTRVWLHVHEAEPVTPEAFGWKIHVSAGHATSVSTLSAVAQLLRGTGINYKCANSTRTLSSLNSGDLGHTQIGKFITIYPPRDELDAVVRQLLATIGHASGPRIVTDYHCGGPIYVRFGPFRPTFARDEMGRAVAVGGDAEVASATYAIPPVPTASLQPPACALPTRQTTGGELLLNRFRLIDNIEPSAKGSVYLAIDAASTSAPIVVLKEARAFAQEYRAGLDRRRRIRREFSILRFLQKNAAGLAPEPRALFDVHDARYLALEWIDGVPLRRALPRPLIGLGGRERDWALRVATGAAEAVATLHDAGVVHGDLKPTNFMFDFKHDRVRMIDFETAYPATRLRNDPLHTAGFIRHGLRGRERGVEGDLFALGVTLSCILTMLPAHRISAVPQRERQQLLHTLIADARIVSLLESLLSASCDARSCSTQLRSIAASDGPHPTESSTHRFADELTERLPKMVSGLMSACPVSRTTNLWASTPVDAGASEYRTMRTVNRGVAGIAYALLLARRFGHDITSEGDVLRRCAEHLEKPTPPMALKGFHFGEAGVAVVLSMLARELRDQNINRRTRSIVDTVCSDASRWPDFTHGLAGKLVALKGLSEFGEGDSQEALRLGALLMEAQAPNGSWPGVDTVARTSQTYFGFAHGAAGIVYALTERSDAWPAIERGIAWLERAAFKGPGGGPVWGTSNESPTPPFRWCSGNPGIALGLLRAYECTREPRYAR